MSKAAKLKEALAAGAGCQPPPDAPANDAGHAPIGSTSVGEPISRDEPQARPGTKRHWEQAKKINLTWMAKVEAMQLEIAAKEAGLNYVKPALAEKMAYLGARLKEMGQINVAVAVHNDGLAMAMASLPIIEEMVGLCTDVPLKLDILRVKNEILKTYLSCGDRILKGASLEAVNARKVKKPVAPAWKPGAVMVPAVAQVNVMIGDKPKEVIHVSGSFVRPRSVGDTQEVAGPGNGGQPATVGQDSSGPGRA